MTQDAAKRALARLKSLPLQFGQEMGPDSQRPYLDAAVAHSDGNVSRAVELCLGNLSTFPTVKQFRDALISTRDAAPAKFHAIPCDGGFVCIHAYYEFCGSARATTVAIPCPVCSPQANARTAATLEAAIRDGRLCKAEQAAL